MGSLHHRSAIDYERAYVEAVEQMSRRDRGSDHWRLPALFWAACKLGRDLLAYPYRAIEVRWRVALDEAIADVRRGKLPGTVPPRREAPPASGNIVVPPEVAKQRLANIREMLAHKDSA